MARYASVLRLPMPVYVDDVALIAPSEDVANDEMAAFQSWASLPPNERRPLTPPQLLSHSRYVIARPLTRVLSRSKLRCTSFPAKTCSMYRSYFLTSKLSQVFSVGLFLWYLRSTMLPAVRRFGLGSGVASSAYAAYQYNTDDGARRAMQMWYHFGPVALHYRLVEAKQAL